MRKKLPAFIFLLSIATSALCQSTQLKKCFIDTTIAAFCTASYPYIDSGFIIQSNTSGPMVSGWKQKLLIVDKTGNIKHQKEFISKDTAYSFEPYNYTRRLCVRKDGGIYSAGGLNNHSGSYINKAVIFSVDSNLNLLWSNALNNVFCFTRSSVLDINGSVYYSNISFTDTTFGITHAINHYDPVLYKFSSTGSLLFGKRYVSDFSSSQANSIYQTSKRELLLLSGCQTRLMAFNPDTIMFGCILLLDTNGNVKQSKRYNYFFPNDLKELNTGNFLISGEFLLDSARTRSVNCFGLFDSLLNPIWLKRMPYVNGPSCYGMEEDESGHYIIQTAYVQDYLSHPFILKTDVAGNLIETFIYNEHTTPFHQFKKDEYGRYVWTSYNQQSQLLLNVTDTIGEMNGCPAMHACFPELLNETLTVSDFDWQVLPINNVQSFPLSTATTFATTQNYCSSSSKLNASFSLAEDTVCPGEPFTLTSSPDLQMGTSEWIIRDSVTGYYKQVNVSALKLNTPGTYPITHIHTLFGCADTIVHDLVVRVRLSAVNDTVSFCDTSTTVKIISAVPGSSSYTWNTGENTPQITVSQSGIYTYAANYGCGKDTGYVTVTIHHAGALNLADDTLVCADKLPLLIGIDTGFTTYLWNTGATTGLISVADSGYYILRAANSCGQQTDSVKVTVATMPAATNAPTYLNIGAGNTVELEACATGTNYVWSGPSILEDHESYIVVNPIETANYLCKVETEYGCEATCSYIVVVQNYFIVPTAFSPNGDGVNDVFRLLNRNIKLKQLNIYSRWGELVYSTDDLTDGWDGTYKGIAQPLGTYVWTAEYTTHDKPETAKGNITLVR